MSLREVENSFFSCRIQVTAYMHCLIICCLSRGTFKHCGSKKKIPTLPEIVFHKTRVELNHKNAFAEDDESMEGEMFRSEIKSEIISFVCLWLSCLFALKKRKIRNKREHIMTSSLPMFALSHLIYITSSSNFNSFRFRRCA